MLAAGTSWPDAIIAVASIVASAAIVIALFYFVSRR